jgi:acyl carrier protein
MAGNTRETVLQILERELGADRSKLLDEAHLFDDLGADSLDVVELTMEIEKALDTDIADDDAQSWRTVGDVIRTALAVVRA